MIKLIDFNTHYCIKYENNNIDYYISIASIDKYIPNLDVKTMCDKIRSLNIKIISVYVTSKKGYRSISGLVHNNKENIQILEDWLNSLLITDKLKGDIL